MKPRKCVDCRRPGPASICGPCKAERRRLFALHRAGRDADRQDERYAAAKAPRVERYRRMAERGEPLFGG